MFSLWRLKEGEKRIDIFDRKRKPIMSPIKEYRELSLRIHNVKKGRYMLVPRYYYQCVSVINSIVVNNLKKLVNSS